MVGLDIKRLGWVVFSMIGMFLIASGGVLSGCIDETKDIGMVACVIVTFVGACTCSFGVFKLITKDTTNN